MGILNYELARIKFNKKNALIIKSLIDKYGIKIVSMQVKPKDIFNNKEEIISFAKTVQCKNIVISMLPFKCILGKENKFYEFINSLNTISNYYKENNMTLAYHHHNWEYIKLSNTRTRFEELIDKTQDIKFVLDTYWIVKSSYSPIKQIEQIKDRLLGIHLRDLKLYSKGIKVYSKDCELGQGIINFKEIISIANNFNCEYFVIEQKTNSPYESIKLSYNYLTNNKII